jgi:hypothetical protein
MGTVLVRAYLVLFVLAICVFVLHGGHPLSGLFILILTLPWSVLAAFPMELIGVSEVGRLLFILFFALLNARLLYRLGEKLH